MFGRSYLMRKASIKKETFVPQVPQQISKSSSFSSVKRSLPKELNEPIRTNSLKSSDLDQKFKSKAVKTSTTKKRTQKVIRKQKVVKTKENVINRTRKS